MYEFARKTGQIGRFRIFVALAIGQILGLILLSTLWNGNPLKLPFFTTLFASLGVGIVALTYWLTAVRCPGCGGSPVWYFVSHKPNSTKGTWSSFKSCPQCGFSPQNSAPSEAPATGRRNPPYLSTIVALVWLETVGYFTFRELIPRGAIGWLLLALLGPPAILAIYWLREHALGPALRQVDRVSDRHFSWLRILAMVLALGLLLLGPAIWRIYHEP